MNLAFLVDGDYVIALKTAHNGYTPMVKSFNHKSPHAMQSVVTQGIAIIGTIPTGFKSSMQSRYVVNDQLEKIREVIHRGDKLVEKDFLRLTATVGYGGLTVILPDDIVLINTITDTIRHYERNIPYSPVANIMGAYMAYRTVESDKRKAAREAFRSLYGHTELIELDLTLGKTIRDQVESSDNG